MGDLAALHLLGVLPKRPADKKSAICLDKFLARLIAVLFSALLYKHDLQRGCIMHHACSPHESTGALYKM